MNENTNPVEEVKDAAEGAQAVAENTADKAKDQVTEIVDKAAEVGSAAVGSVIGFLGKAKDAAVAAAEKATNKDLDGDGTVGS